MGVGSGSAGLALAGEEAKMPREMPSGERGQEAGKTLRLASEASRPSSGDGGDTAWERPAPAPPHSTDSRRPHDGVPGPARPAVGARELVEEEPKQDAAAEPARIGKKRSSPVEVRRSERLKRLKM